MSGFGRDRPAGGRNKGLTVWTMRLAAAILLLAGVASACWYAWQRYAVTHTVSPEEDGDVVSKVVEARLKAARDLRVSVLRGTVQSVACVDRLGGMLHPCRTFKAPFAVDYFVDLSRLQTADFRWNAGRRLLVVRVPSVAPAPPNIDESRITYDGISGLWVSRGAFQELRRKGSIRARDVAADYAAKPRWIDAVRRSARTAIARQFAMPLAAAGVRAKVEVLFPEDGGRDQGGAALNELTAAS